MQNAPIVNELLSAVKTMLMFFRMFVGGVATMNEQQLTLIQAVMEMLDGTIHTMEQDEFHAPAKWVLENWWHSLNAALQIGNHCDSKLNSLEPTDQTESEKRDEDVQTDQAFEV